MGSTHHLALQAELRILEQTGPSSRLTFVVKTLRVTVRFARGLHVRPAASLVTLLKRFRSHVVFQTGNRIANARSLLSILLLSATFNTELEVQATGEDEEAAIRAAESFFQHDDEESARQLRIETLPPSQQDAQS